MNSSSASAATAALFVSLLAGSLPATAETKIGNRAGDPARGAEEYENHCAGCHSVETNRVGPRHKGVVGRRAGSVAGFDYSPALKKAGFAWTVELIDRWLTNPEKLVPGQAMGFSISEPQLRADIIAFLNEKAK